MSIRSGSFSIQQGSRKFTIRVFEEISPEDLLVWASKGFMYHTLMGEANPMQPIPRSVKDQLLLPNVSR